MNRRQARSEIIREIREFFFAREFLETDTPTLVLSPGMEPHIRPLRVEGGGAFLPTSPEFAMKRILADGFPRIFQICKAYRFEPRSATHNPEFTILEWYRTGTGYEAIMDDVEALFEAIALKVRGSTRFDAGPHGQQDVSRPWPRLSIEECFKRFAGLDLRRLMTVEPLARACVDRAWAAPSALEERELSRPGAWDDLFFRVMLNSIEPGLAKLGKPAIVHLYPESQAALSNVQTDPEGLRWAKRFEVYAGGLELGNAFDELTDPMEQRRRFEKDMRLRRDLYGDGFPENPIDEEFLAALEKMPPCGGIAMGVDRMAMYFTGAADIDEVLWLPSHWDGARVQ